jgi:hypothetical protein
MKELNFDISNKFAKTSTSSGENTRGEKLKNTREESNSTLNDANNKHEQLTMPVDASQISQILSKL